MKGKQIFSCMLVLLVIFSAVLCCSLFTGADAEYIDLTTVTPKSVQVGYGSLCVNKGLDGDTIDMANTEGGTTVYPTGFTAHADSTLEFDISNLSAQVFTAFIGAEHSSSNATPTSTSIKFIVNVDGTNLYESDVFGYNDPAQEIFVNIPQGAKILKLITDSVGSNTGDHSSWGSPRLLTDPTVLEVFKEIQLSAEKNVYLTGSKVQLKAVFLNVGGKEFTPETVKYESSDTSVATVDSKGLITSIKDGLVRFTVTATHKDVTLSKTIAISFMDKAEVKNFTVSSPSKNLTMALTLDDQGMLSYVLTDKDGLTVLEKSFIGIETEFCDFSNALVFNTQAPAQEFDETYSMISGKKSSIRNHYIETVLSFKKDQYLFDVYIRIYDDGFAYRFNLRRADGTEEKLTVVKETNTFKIPSKSVVSAEFISTLTSSFCYETGYNNQTVDNIKSSYTCFPALISVYKDQQKSGKYLLLSEADLYGDSYAGSVMFTNSKCEFGMTFAPKVSYGSKVEITTSFTSPWRYGIYGELGDVVESCMTENLAGAPEGEYSWVVPGVTAWMWLSEGFQGQRTEATIRDYVDLASEMGWKYLILDEGWQPGSTNPDKKYDGYFKYFDDLIEYANSKGVGFIVWVKYCDLDTPKEREVLVEWAKKGIKGIKADFFDSEDQTTIADLAEIYRICAENHLIVNCHGACKPTGERRTFPNVINREAVNGEEYGGFWINAAVYWAYARNVVGPMDITPRLYSSDSAGNTTVAQMACNIVFECGMPCMAGDSEDYRNFNCKSFYKNLPAAWDDIHFIDGNVGSWVSIARRSGDIWYAATICDGVKKNISMSLDFLGEGKYYAVIYEDQTRKNVVMSSREVTNKDTLTYSVLSKGGYVVKFIKADLDGKYIPSGITAPETVELYAGFRDVLAYTLVGEDIQIAEVQFATSDSSVVAVNGKGVLTAVKAGVAEVTVSSIANKEIKTTVRVIVKPSPFKLSPDFSIANEGSDVSYRPVIVLNDMSKIQVVTNPGTLGSGALSNELLYKLPDGDFKLYISVDSAPTFPDLAVGAVLHMGGKYAAVERAYTDKNILRYVASGSKETSKNDLRVGENSAGIWVSFERTGNTLTVYGGNAKSTLTKYGTFTVAEGTELTMGLYATNGKSENIETYTFSRFTLNDENVNFAYEEAQPDPTPDPTPDQTESLPSTSSKDDPGTTDDKGSPIVWIVVGTIIGAVVLGVLVAVVVAKVKKKKKTV